MNAQVLEISTVGLAIAMLPTVIVIFVMWRWSAGPMSAINASVRMLIQLFLIGYVLVQLFATDESWIVLAVLLLMLGVSSWIAIRTVAERRPSLYRNAFVAIALPGAATLALVSHWVIGVEPWFSPRYLIPLAGMIFAGAMNSVSLAAERQHAELAHGVSSAEARRIAFIASLIPMINSLFAVGLVSLPGMMTGQILSGISPLVAAKYQIVVMSMLFGVAGMSSALFLTLQQRAEND